MKPCLAWVTFVGSFNLACGPSYGPAFPDVGAASRDVYLYGAHDGSVQRRTQAVPSATSGAASADAATEFADTSEHSATDVKERIAKSSPDALRPPAEESIVGTYRGTDWVTIDLLGFPESEQVDDKARTVVTNLDDPQRFTFTVLDTNSGSELCSVNATRVNQLLVFEPGQACFTGILGIPMQAVLYEGEGRVEKGGQLDVTLGIELTVQGPEGELSGDLAYRFEGKLDDE